jgi:hypothetical protein
MSRIYKKEISSGNNQIVCKQNRKGVERMGEAELETHCQSPSSRK